MLDVFVGNHRVIKLDYHNWCIDKHYENKKGVMVWGQRKYYPSPEKACTSLLSVVVGEDDVESLNGIINAVEMAKIDIVNAINK